MSFGLYDPYLSSDECRKELADAMQKTLEDSGIDYKIPGSYKDVKDDGGGSVFSDFLSMQEFLNKKSMNTAKETWATQKEADIAAMNFSASETQKLRDWQAEQSNTAYQRATADMRVAGLNPALMFASGSAASTPSGAAASGISSARQIPQLNLENYVYQFKSLVRSLESSERNTDTMASAQKYAATLNAATNVFGTLAEMGALKPKRNTMGFGS